MMANIFQVRERETDDNTVIKLFFCVKSPPTVLFPTGIKHKHLYTNPQNKLVLTEMFKYDTNKYLK